MKIYKVTGHYYDSDYEMVELNLPYFKTEMSTLDYIIRLKKLSNKLYDFYINRYGDMSVDAVTNDDFTKYCYPDGYYECLMKRCELWSTKSLDYIEIEVRD